MHGTGELFSEFIHALRDAMPGIGTIESLNFPTDENHSYQQLLVTLQKSVPATEPFILLAESFSTPLAIQFAARQPQNLRGLILCTGFGSSPAKGWRRLAGLFLAPILFRLPLPGAAVSFWLAGPGAPPSLLHAVRAAISSVRPKVLSARLRAVLCCDVRHELSRIEVPILLLQASRDRLVPASSAEEMLLIRPDATLKTLEGPHLLLQREPHKAAAAVRDFIDPLN
jgi:pimeloyl-[acyl-carrier protein] methyl ester esterase